MTPRQTAYRIYHDIRTNDLYANLVLPKGIRQARLNKTDAAFVTELVYGTIRRERLYDRIIEQAASRRCEELDPEVVEILRLGAHQALSMRTAIHAAVNETVNLAKTFVHPGAAKFVNAIMRKISRHSREEWFDIVTENITDEDERLAIYYSQPVWIVRALRDSLSHAGLESELHDVLEINNRPPYVHLVARPGLIDWEELADQAEYRLDAAVAETPLSPYGMMISGGDPGRIAAVRDGRAAVEDQGSQLVALIAAHAPIDGSDTRWLDMCAGPGGKAALIASIGAQHDPPSMLTALELYPKRAALVTDTTRRLDNVSVQATDATQFVPKGDLYDRILVDVPCTGIGALRRRPELRWRERHEDLPVMTDTQFALLNNAIDCLRPGGVVTYATCSPVIGETVDVIDRVCAGRSDIIINDARQVAADIVGADFVDSLGPTDTPYVQLWPHRHESDAMFCAVITKKG